MQYTSKSQDLTSHPSQSGRTMVEIIGALAIMGVLSIASFAVYRVAIDWYRANEITHGIMERSVIVRQQRDLDAELNLKEFHPDTDKDYIMGHEVTLDIYDHEAAGLTQADAMTVHDVSNTVCRRIASVTGWDNMILFVNDVETDPENIVASMDLCRAEETNDLTFAFWDGETIDVEEPEPGVGPGTERDCGSDGTTLYRHGDNYGDCGKCDNGVFVGRSVSIPECQKCGSGTDWKLVNNDNVSCGTNKVCQSGACTCKIGTTPKTGTADTCVECNTNADCKDASKPVCNASGICEPCTTATVTHSDINESGCCVTSTETYCPATDETPTARTCTQTCSGTCETDGTCTPATLTCTGDLVLNGDETACVCPTGKVVKTGTTDTCVECNTNTDCTDTAKPVCNTSGVCEAASYEGVSCANNDDCGGNVSKYFCNYNGNVDCSNGPSGKAGTCEVHQFGNLPIDSVNEGYFRSSNTLDWYSAKNFCESYHNGRLVSLSNMDLESAIPRGTNWCSGYIGTNACQNISAEEWSTVQTMFGSDYYPWTVDIVPGDSCAAYAVNLYYSDVYFDDSNRDDIYGGYALCRRFQISPLQGK